MPMTRGRINFRPPSSQMSKPFIPHTTFDIIQCENVFQRVRPAPDDKSFTEAILKRVHELTPSPHEQAVVLSLVTKIQLVLDNLVVAPGSFEAAQLDEVRQIGPYKKGTIMAGNNSADVVVMLRTLPTFESVRSLSNQVYHDLVCANPKEVFTLLLNDHGFEIKSVNASVKILISTIPPNFKKLDPLIHLDMKIMQEHLSSIRQTRWFEENASHSSIKVLVRLLQDLRSRFTGLESLSTWIIELFAHHCVMNTPQRQPLPINLAFRRCLQLLAGGFFLPGSAGIYDPCEPNSIRVHTSLTLEQQDQVCHTAQTLLRVLSHGGYNYILGFKNDLNITSQVTFWNGVVVTPSEKAYEREEEDKAAEIAPLEPNGSGENTSA